MKAKHYNHWEKEWRRLKRLRFFYLVLPVFLTMLSIRIIQTYFHLKMAQLKSAAASCTAVRPQPVPLKKEAFPTETIDTPVVSHPADSGKEITKNISSCTVTEESAPTV